MESWLCTIHEQPMEQNQIVTSTPSCFIAVLQAEMILKAEQEDSLRGDDAQSQ